MREPSVNAAIAALAEHLKDVEIQFSETEPTFRKDRQNTGDRRELSVRELLESFFPPTYTIRKCAIFSRDGATSQNIDCVVLHPVHPRLETPKRVIAVAEGVYAAIEVKPDIRTLTSSSEFARGLAQIQSVKRLSRKVFDLNAGLGNHEKVLLAPQQRIPGVIFAKSAQGANETIAFMRDTARVTSGDKLPDLVVALDRKYVIFHTMCIERTFATVICKGATGEAYVLIDAADMVLAMFMMTLYTFTPPSPSFSGDFILKPYLTDALLQCKITCLNAEGSEIGRLHSPVRALGDLKELLKSLPQKVG
jgi:hypothetical protein